MAEEEQPSSELARALTTSAARSGGKQSASLEENSGWGAFELLFRDNPQPMWIYDRATTRFLAVNDAAVAKYGYTRDEFLTMTLADIRPAEDVSRLMEIVTAPLMKGYKISTGWRHLHKDGTPIYVTIHSHEIAYRDRDAALVMAADVTELYDVIERLEEQTAYFQQLFANSPNGIVLLDGEGKILDANAAFQKMFGYGIDELRGRTPMSLIVPDDEAQESLAAFSRNRDANEAVRMTAARRHKDGRILDVEILAYPVHTNGKTLGIFAVYYDITERQRALRELEHQARHDALTDLVNRSEFMRRLETALREARDRRSRHAFLYLDIDQFKVINDTCGHSAGDRVIVELSHLLKSSLREADVIARLGGDEFGVLLPGCDQEMALQRARQLLDAVGGYQFVWHTRRFPLAVSIGVVEISADMTTAEQTLSAADAACYAAKERGRNRIQLYDAEDAHFVARRNEMAWVSRLNAALEQDRFVLFHQDLLALHDVTAAARHREILVRYRNEEDRLVPPGAFIPAAERYNLMPAIDRWVLRKVCERAARSQRSEPGREILCINVSGTTLSDEKFPDFVKETLAATGMDAAALCFEVTETAAISNLALARRFIAEMKALGCSIALDDFGSGMSSFNYLRSLTVDYLKIDGTFVKHLHENPVDRAMTEAINNVGKVLGLKTIAEFVENREILEHLRRIGVDYAQGYGIHVPELWQE